MPYGNRSCSIDQFWFLRLISELAMKCRGGSHTEKKKRKKKNTKQKLGKFVKLCSNTLFLYIWRKRYRSSITFTVEDCEKWLPPSGLDFVIHEPLIMRTIYIYIYCQFFTMMRPKYSDKHAAVFGSVVVQNIFIG